MDQPSPLNKAIQKISRTHPKQKSPKEKFLP